MTTGQRMKSRRKEIGLSAERVAEILGVSPATIYRYENGDIEKVPGDRLEPIAAALQTTPQALMGWEEFRQPSIEQKEKPALVSESGPLYPANYDKLSPANKAIVDRLIADLVKNQLPD